MKIENLQQLFTDELQDLYDAETRIIEALPKMAEKASSPELRSAFQQHLRETEGQKLTEARQIYVAPTMRVTLLDDPNFEAKAKTPDVQETGTDRAATWQWSLRPLLPGKHTLYARVEVLQRAQNGELSSVESYTRRVAIVVKSGMWNNSVGAMEKATSLGDLLGKLFGSWRGALAALTLLIGAAVALWAAITKL